MEGLLSTGGERRGSTQCRPERDGPPGRHTRVSGGAQQQRSRRWGISGRAETRLRERRGDERQRQSEQLRRHGRLAGGQAQRSGVQEADLVQVNMRFNSNLRVRAQHCVYFSTIWRGGTCQMVCLCALLNNANPICCANQHLPTQIIIYSIIIIIDILVGCPCERRFRLLLREQQWH